MLKKGTQLFINDSMSFQLGKVYIKRKKVLKHIEKDTVKPTK